MYLAGWILYTRFQRFCAGFAIGFGCGDNDYRNPLQKIALFQSFAGFNAVHDGHNKIEEDHIGAFSEGLLNALPA